MISTLVSRLPTPIRNQIEHRINLLRAAENTGWIIANQVVRLVIGMVVGVWVARYLGAEQYGLFNYAMSFNMLLRSVIPLGINSLLMRDLARDHEDRNTILGSAFAVQLLVSVMMVFVSVGNAIFLQQDDPISQKLTLILSVILIMIPFEIVGPWFQSQLQAVKVLIANTTSLLLMAAVRIWLVQTNASLEAFIYLVIVERIVNIGTLLYLYHKSGERIRLWRFDRKWASGMAWEGTPFFWSMLARSVYTRGTEMMVKSLASPTALGYFSASVRIIDLYAVVPMAIISSATPIISRSKVQDRTLYLQQMTHLFRITSAIGLASTVMLGLLAPWLMPIVYGPEFAGAGSVLVVHLWATIPTSFSMIAGLWVLNEGLIAVQFQKVLASAAIIVSLNWVLIPRQGAPGAAMSIFIASVLVNILWDFVDPRMRSLGLLKLHALMPWWFGLKNL